MTDYTDDDRPIETSEDEAKPFVDASPTRALVVRLERAEKALLAGGFTLRKDGHWLPPSNTAISMPLRPKSGVLTNDDLVELTKGLNQGAA